MPSTDSTELMQRVADDDEGALGALIAAFAPQLLRFARRMLPGDPEEAEDVVQDTFVRVWSARRRDPLEHDGSFKLTHYPPGDPLDNAGSGQ